MNLVKIFSLILVLSVAFQSCELLEPVDENRYTLDRAYNDPAYAEGILIKAYTNLPTNSLSFNDVATDNAVSNDNFNSYRRAATGEWSSKYNPFNEWDRCNEAILYLNYFLDNVVDSVEWKWTEPQLTMLYRKRFKGEAYALRALFKYHLLITMGGIGQNNELLGFPIYEKSIESDFDEFNKPRAGFIESINSIYSDISKSLEQFTMDKFVNINSADELPEGYKDVTEISFYNDVFGNNANQRINGQFAKALKARVALLAASPAFSDGDQSLWENAANYAADVLNDIGGIDGMDPVGHIFYLGQYVDLLNVVSGIDQQEIILRTPRTTSNSRERNNFPPSLFGNGRVNPSQNLVDAFPMDNGYPINHPSSGYDDKEPYKNRDPRLSNYIVYNGSAMSNKIIITGEGGGIDSKDSISTSTRSGYYLRKLLREDVNADPTSQTSRNHYETHMRFTELFLIYAEAANEAWGPDGTGGHGYSARDVISAIRERAGIDSSDSYLASISNQEDMRELIRNERRLELCFEGFRFWDLRRWKLDLTETARGINIDLAGNYELLDIEERRYNNEFMHYGPLPESEIVKFSELIQNTGW
jgi:hypothetical protein